MQEKVFEEGIEERTAQTDMIKCSSCGSNMLFNPDNQKLECPHCGNTQTIETIETAKELDLSAGLPKWEKEDTVVFECDNCGAKVVLESGQSSADCPFCGTPHVRKIEELAGIKPNAVLPFSIGRDKALELTKEWAKRKWFAPRKFKKNIKTQNISGVYAPCFTFDSSTTSTYVGRVGQTRTKVVGSGKNRRTVTYVVWRNISGTFRHKFDDILVTAGSKFTQKELNSVSPFNTNQSKEYDKDYLMGFMAYHYDKDVKSCWLQAKTSIDVSLRRMILSQYPHDRVAFLNVSTAHSDLTYKYVMLPVYVGNFSFKQKLYNFFVNGSTGRVNGKTPKSPLKVALAVLGAIALVVGIVLLASNCV